MSSETHTDTTVAVHDVIIDKLSITFDIPNTQMNALAPRLQEFAHTSFGSGCWNPNYQTGARIWLNEGIVKEKSRTSCITVHTQPKFAHYKSCRVEWNPSQIAVDEVAYIAFNDYLDLDFTTLWDGKVTRIDLAIDVDNVMIEEFLFHVPKFQLFENRYKSGMTRYLGGRSGNCCYDKIAQLNARNAKTHASNRVAVPDHPRMRLEAVLRPDLWCPEIREIPNPFESLQLRRFSAATIDVKKGGSDLLLLLQLARYRGLNAALAVCKKRDRKRLLQQVLESQETCHWWDPAGPWGGFEKRFLEIDALMNPESVAFKNAANFV